MFVISIWLSSGIKVIFDYYSYVKIKGLNLN
jgi:hypothetical protein